MWSDGEGSNIRLYRYGVNNYWEIDTYPTNSLRMYYVENDNITTFYDFEKDGNIVTSQGSTFANRNTLSDWTSSITLNHAQMKIYKNTELNGASYNDGNLVLESDGDTYRCGIGFHYRGVVGIFLYYDPSTGRFQTMKNDGQTYHLMTSLDYVIDGTTLNITI